MKRTTFVLLLTLLAGIFLAPSCKKQLNANDELSATATDATGSATSITREPACSTCTTNFNLVEKQRTLTYREGLNAISPLANGLTAFAKVQKGSTTQFVLQDKSGKQYLPQSIKTTSQRSLMPGGRWVEIYVICYYTPYGWYCIWIAF